MHSGRAGRLLVASSRYSGGVLLERESFLYNNLKRLELLPEGEMVVAIYFARPGRTPCALRSLGERLN